jgi:hypothetical protein
MRRRREAGEEACAEGSDGRGVGGERWETASGRSGRVGSRRIEGGEVESSSRVSKVSISGEMRRWCLEMMEGSFRASRREAAIRRPDAEGKGKEGRSVWPAESVWWRWAAQVHS